MRIDTGQSKAATNKFSIYRSSAGSGKTFTLTKEYLKLVFTTPGSQLFTPFYFRNILAVTFTNDAANEMKERILSNLMEIANLPKEGIHPMLTLLQEEIKQEYPDKFKEVGELKKYAASIHETILHNYADFSVSTIDAFSSKIVQSFKKDLGLPYSFEVELDVDELIDEAVDFLQDEIGLKENKELTYFLVDYAKKKADAEKSWYIDDSLKSFAFQLFKEDTIHFIDSLADISLQDFKKIIGELYQYLASVDNAVKQVGIDAMHLLHAYNIDSNDLYYGKNGIGGLYKKLQEGKKINEINIENGHIQKFVYEDKLCGSKVNAETKAAVEQIKPHLVDFYERLARLVNKELSNYIIASNLSRNIYLLAIINELKKKLDEIKQDKHIVHISDFNRKINEIVEEEPVPYIYERIGERYKHILIDEFQDTSKMQWHNLIPLLLNALGQNMANLVVGDAKQAIYRWRGGKASMLVDLPHVPTIEKEAVLAAELNTFVTHENSLSLKVNRRSKDNIVAFNNDLFTALKDEFSTVFPALPAFYKDVTQATNSKSGGSVSMEFIAENATNSVYKDTVFIRILEQVKVLVEKFHYNYSDIAILVRKNSDGSFIAEKLMSKGFNVVSNDSLLLANAPIVQFIINFLKVIAFPVNALIKMELVQFLDEYSKNKQSDYEKLKGDVYEDLVEIINKNDLENYFEWINHHFSTSLQAKGIQFRTIYEIAEELIRQFGLHEQDEQQIYLQELLDVVLAFSTKKGNSILDFLDFWEFKKDKLSVSSPSKSDAIKVMSLHKSKGLQFPVVIIPFADWELKGKRNEKWFNWTGAPIGGKLENIMLSLSNQLEKTSMAAAYLEECEQQFIEGINMLYVGCTRAEEKLFTISKVKSLPKKATVPSQINQMLFNYASQHLPSESKEAFAIDFTDDHGEHHSVDTQIFEPYIDESEVEESEANQAAKVHQYDLNAFIHTASLNKIRMRKNTLRYDDSDISLSQIFSARKAGIIMHYAFEKIKFASDISPAVDEIVSEGLISVEEAATYKEKMTQVVNLPEISTYFQPSEGIKIKNEKEIILGGKATTTGTSLRPDRIVRYKDELVIIDYKTGQENEEKYADQIKSYARAFKAMGYENVKMFIIYTETCEVKEVK